MSNTNAEINTILFQLILHIIFPRCNKASFFFLVEFKYIKKIIHMSTCIRKYIFLILNSATKKKIAITWIYFSNNLKYSTKKDKIYKKVTTYKNIYRIYHMLEIIFLLKPLRTRSISFWNLIRALSSQEHKNTFYLISF